MSATWVNVYKRCNGLPWHSAYQAETMRDGDYIRVEERRNGHWRRTPVGIRGSEASHYRSSFRPWEWVKR
jgi:hypothetical protein